MINYVSVHGTSLTDGMKSYWEKRFSHFDKYLEKNDKVSVNLKAQKTGFKLEVTINGGFGAPVRGEVRRKDFYEATDAVEEVVVRNLVKRKEKKIQRHRGGNDLIVQEAAADHVFAKEKIHELESMTQDQACDCMELTDHSFYVYCDSDRNDAVCVVYVREDGAYGLLIFK